MNRATAAVLSIVLIGATASPVLRKPWEDGFPLSPYAMFAFRRPTKLTMDYALGETATGERRTLSPRIIGSGEVLQALQVIKHARRTGALPALCERIAGRVSVLEDYRDVIRIRIVSGTHDAVDFLVRDVVGRELERARCEVRR